MQTTDWTLSHHARMRAAELGFPLTDLLLAAAQPEQAYQQARYGPDNWMHQRGDVAVAVDRRHRAVITVVLRRGDQWQHGRDRRAG